MKPTNWKKEKENMDGTGYTFYSCKCPQYDKEGRLSHLYMLCYSPKHKELWFWDESYEDSERIKMTQVLKEDAEKIKNLLSMKKKGEINEDKNHRITS